jgi:hypothetical protein
MARFFVASLRTSRREREDSFREAEKSRAVRGQVADKSVWRPPSPDPQPAKPRKCGQKIYPARTTEPKRQIGDCVVRGAVTSEPVFGGETGTVPVF